MLRKILTAVIVVPLAVLIIVFAVANRQAVTVSFDPFSATHPAYAVTLPLFVLIFILVILGVIVGGSASWLRQGRWRRSARRLDADLHALRGEMEAIRRSFGPHPQQGAAGPKAEPKPAPAIPPPDA
jgi:uncharacterized integral membrane protein